MVGVIAYPLGLEVWLSVTNASPGQEQTILMAGVRLLSTDLGETGPTFAAVLVGVAPIALACAFFADRYAVGLGTGIID